MASVPPPRDPRLSGPIIPKKWGIQRSIFDEFWCPGRIISAPIHTVAWGEVAPAPSWEMTLNNQGQWVYSKLRKMIVIQNFTAHITAIPLFTHKTQGLRERTDIDEHVGVRSITMRNEEKAATESPNANIIAKITWQWSPRDPFHGYDTTVYAHVTKTVSFDKSSACHNEGVLADGSLERLLALYRQNNPVCCPALSLASASTVLPTATTTILVPGTSATTAKITTLSYAAVAAISRRATTPVAR